MGPHILSSVRTAVDISSSMTTSIDYMFNCWMTTKVFLTDGRRLKVLFPEDVRGVGAELEQKSGCFVFRNADWREAQKFSAASRTLSECAQIG